MRKKNFSERLEFLNDGRRCFLEFMRSLSPITVFMTLALFLALRLRTIPFGWNANYMGKLVSIIMLSVVLALASYASVSLFYRDCFKDLRSWKEAQEKRLKQEGKKGFRYGFTVVKEIWEHRFVEVLEFALLVPVLQVALGGACVVAIITAFNYFGVQHQVVVTSTAPNFVSASTPVSTIATSGDVLSPVVLELVKGIPTALIALIAAFIAYRQYRVAHAKLKLDLFEKRYVIFLETWKILSKVVSSGTRTESFGLGTPFNNYLPQAAFLFGTDIESYLKDAIRKWTELWALEGEIGGQGVNDAGATQKIMELRGWFFEEASSGAKLRFSKYLDFEEWK